MVLDIYRRPVYLTSVVSDRTTKERILDAAETIMLEKSFHSVGLNEILRSVKVPKGSFYHYFESKEQFGVELLRHYVANATAYKRSMLLSPAADPDRLRRLITYLESNVAKLCASQGKCPCLVVKLASEVADMSESMREVLAAGQEQWAGLMEEFLREGIQNGTINPSVDPHHMAPVIWDLWTGAMQRAAIQRSVTPLRDAIDFIRARLSTVA